MYITFTGWTHCSIAIINECLMRRSPLLLARRHASPPGCSPLAGQLYQQQPPPGLHTVDETPHMLPACTRLARPGAQASCRWSC
jgi:hypothetical protein